MAKPLRILLTGGRENIGTHLAKALRAMGHEVYTYDRHHHSDPGSWHAKADVSNFRQLERAKQVSRPDIVYLSLPFIRLALQAAILSYKWCKPPTCFSSITLPFSLI